MNNSDNVESRMVIRKQKFDEMITNLVSKYHEGDFRKSLGLFVGEKIEVKWFIVEKDEYQWLNAEIVELDTDTSYKFSESDETDELKNEYNTVQLCPIIRVKDDEGIVSNVCFLSDQVIFHTESEFLNFWRKAGSTFEVSDDEVERILFSGSDGEKDDEDGDDTDYIGEDEEEEEEEEEEENEEDESKLSEISFSVSSDNDIRENIDRILLGTYKDIFSSFGDDRLKQLTYFQQSDYASAVCMLRETQVELLTDFFSQKLMLQKETNQHKSIVSINASQVKEILKRAYEVVKIKLHNYHLS